jgi:CHAD domain-containing protein
MGYRFRHDDESVEAGFRRIAGEQLTKALASLEDDGALHAGVHDARKRVKKLRGLLRLVRPAFKGFARGERGGCGMRRGRCRAARPCGDDRDAGPAGGAASGADRRAADGAAAPRARGAAGRGGGADDLGDRIEAFRKVLRDAKDRAEGWRLKAEGWDALGPGLARSTGRGARRWRSRTRPGRGEDFHEFRKRVKDHGYHARLLAPVWPVLMEPYAALLDDLGEVLGEQHDLVAFAPVVAGSALAPEARAGLEELVVEERRRLEARALVIGARVYAEKPKAMARRMGAWWAAWAADPTAVDQDDAKDPPSAASISAMLSAIP